MLHTADQRTAAEQQEHRAAERQERRSQPRTAALAMQAVLAGTRLDSLPLETVRQLAGKVGNSAMLDLLALQRLGRPEAPRWPAFDAPADTLPVPVEPAAPLLAEPPAGFGGGEGCIQSGS